MNDIDIFTRALSATAKRSKITPEMDARKWKPSKSYVDVDVMLRFLPSLPNEPAVLAFQRHTVKRRQWSYIGEVCRAGCPVCAYEQASGLPLGQTTQCFAMNVVIGDDPVHPGNNGRVLVWEFGKQVAESYRDAAVFLKASPADLERGAWFTMRMTTRGKSTQYTESTFGVSEPLADDGEILQAVLAKRHSLLDFPSRAEKDLTDSFNALKLPLIPS